MYDGPYRVTLVTDAGTYGKITWDLSKTTLTIGGSNMTFAASSLCNPTPNVPAANETDQSLTFDIQTSYVCTVSLTPNFGNDKRTMSKQFSFTTGAGQLIVTAPTSMNTILKGGENLGGFVFENDNSKSITLTGMDIDVAYAGLDVTNGPLILRFENPATNVSLDDYHLETLAVDPSRPYAHAGTDIHIPISFTINAASQEMLPVDLLGVQRLNISGVDPTATISVRQVTTNQNLNRIVVDAASISWSCTVPVGEFDPNATSGPYATGRVCAQ